MPKFQDLTGKTFGRLTVIKRVEDYVAPSEKHLTQWLCKCECGNEVIVQTCSLKSGRTTSCGCVQKEKASKLATEHCTKHGLVHTRIYKTWNDMKARCYNPNFKEYKNYGGRGITVCDEWKEDFQNFYDWAMDNGYKDNLTIDRIDVNKGYSPDNCRWADMKTQCRNKTNNRLITINGETRCVVEWCEILNLNYKTVHSRLNIYHWSPERALGIAS